MLFSDVKRELEVERLASVSKWLGGFYGRGEDIGEGKGLRWFFSIIEKVTGICLGFLVLAILCNALC